MASRTVLVTAIGGPTGYGVVTCLRAVEGLCIVGTDSDAACPTRHSVPTFMVTPRVGSDAYYDSLRSIVASRKVDAIIPTLQSELEVIDRLRAIAPVIGAETHAIQGALNKAVSYDRIARAGLSEFVPKHGVFRSLSEFRRLCEELSYPEVPICVKPISGHGGIGFRIVASRDQISSGAHQQMNWLTRREAEQLLSLGDVRRGALAMEYLPGDEYSVDVLTKEGAVVLAVPRRRTRVIGGVVVRGITENRPELIGAAQATVPVLGLEYFCNIQFRYSSTGLPMLIDVNPRFCGSQVHSYGAGVNFPELSLRMFFNEPYAVPVPRWGVEMVRYWESAFSDVRAQECTKQ